MTKANEPVTAEKTVNSAVPAKNTKPAAKYSIQKLRENCMQLFNITTSTFDGAAYGLNGCYTVDEMRSIINRWYSKEVR